MSSAGHRVEGKVVRGLAAALLAVCLLGPGVPAAAPPRDRDRRRTSPYVKAIRDRAAARRAAHAPRLWLTARGAQAGGR